MREAVVISIGNELLNGFTINSNLRIISKELTLAGYKVRRGLVVRDDTSEIAWALGIGTEHDLVVTTGGLGPTFDDITSRSLAEFLGVPLEENSEARGYLDDWYRKIGLPFTQERLKMAMMPRGSEALRNPVGAAPGILTRFNDCTIISLPGVPAENDGIIHSIRSRLTVRGWVNLERVYSVPGALESKLADVVNRTMKQMDGKVYIKSHPMNSESGNPGVILQITASGSDRNTVEGDLVRTVELLRKLLNNKESKLDLFPIVEDGEPG